MKAGTFLSLLLTALLCHAPAGSAQERDPAMVRGQDILQPFKQTLMQALQAGLQQGPVAALDACRLQAPAIADALSVDGVAVGRTSHKLRNPANASPAWASPLLAAYLEDPDDRAPHTVSLDDGRTGYVEPIILQPLCTTCHGDAIAGPVLERIHALYPQDQATGFTPGELRGIFWAEFPAR